MSSLCPSKLKYSILILMYSIVSYSVLFCSVLYTQWLFPSVLNTQQKHEDILKKTKKPISYSLYHCEIMCFFFSKICLSVDFPSQTSQTSASHSHFCSNLTAHQSILLSFGLKYLQPCQLIDEEPLWDKYIICILTAWMEGYWSNHWQHLSH